MIDPLPYTASMRMKRLATLTIPLIANVLLSWALLPLIIPPFGGYTLQQFGEVIFWQIIAVIGWPFAILGALISFPFNPDPSTLGAVSLTLMYPVMLALLLRVLTSKALKRWSYILLHGLVSLSFAIIWYQVLNGYEFMSG